MTVEYSGMESGGVRPSGTVTFLFTDIEGSTKRWEADPEAMRSELAVHDEVLRTAVEGEGGWLFKHTGDGVCAAFQSARSAVDAAVVAQRRLGLPVRMGISSGEAELRGDDYFGSTLNTAARVMAAGHGGQILLAASTAVLTSDVDVVDLGLRSLRDLSVPVHLFQVRADGLRAEFPSLRTVDVVPGNLPVQESSFIGRDDAVDTIADAVREHRVVTLIGVGGVGKTRLAVQSAAMLAPTFHDGVWLIELAPVTDGDGVDAAVAAVFMLQPQPERTWRQVVVDGLSGREVLLVIDNCEHVLDETAALVEALAACASAKVLVTSRESLAIGSEWAWRVPSLQDAAAVELFTERADTAASGFRPDDADLAVIGEICDRLDGIALAIELAAARVRSMSPTQIRDRLDERFRLLTGSRRSIERHQTLRHAVQWSYDLLEPVEQVVLQQVSVCVGGFNLELATAITGLDEYEVLDILDSLVRKSLLHVERGDGDVRYGMLETIRQFAEETLAATGTSDEIRDRHAHYFADQTAIAFAAWLNDDERLAYRFVDDEISNLAAGFQWVLSRQDTDAAVGIAANTHFIARNRLRTETFGWPEQALAQARLEGHRQLPFLLAAASDAATGVGRYDDAVGYGLEADALNDDDRYDFTIHAYWLTGQALFQTNDVEQSMRVLRKGAEHPADAPVRVNLLYLHIFALFGGVATSRQETMDAVEQLKESSMPTVRAGGLWVHAMAVADDDPSASIALCQTALDADTGSRILEESIRGFQLGVIARTGDIEAALAGFTFIVDAYQASSGDFYTRGGLARLVEWLARLGYHDGAACLWGVVSLGRADWINPPPEVATLPDTMGDEAFSAALEAGAALDLRATGELVHQLLAQVRTDHLGSEVSRVTTLSTPS